MTVDIAAMRDKIVQNLCDRFVTTWKDEFEPLLSEVEGLQAELELLREAAQYAIQVLHDHGLYRAENKLRAALGMEEWKA